MLCFLFIILIIGCKQDEQKEILVERDNYVQEIKVKENVLKNFTYSDISRYAITSIMGQPAKTIKVSKADDLYFVSYVRKSDKQKFDYKIKFEENKILWANSDGRWRDSEYDEKITFEENDMTLKIIQTFSDNSQDIHEFKKGD